MGGGGGGYGDMGPELPEGTEGKSMMPSWAAGTWMDPAVQAHARAIDPATGRPFGYAASAYTVNPQNYKTMNDNFMDHRGTALAAMGLPAGTNKTNFLQNLLHALSGGAPGTTPDAHIADGTTDPWSDWRHRGGGGGALGGASSGASGSTGAAAGTGSSLGQSVSAGGGGYGGFGALLSFLRGH